MLQELAELKLSILEGRYADALSLLAQLDGMSKQAKIDAIESFAVRLMLHLIKNQLEQRLTNSWAASIRSSLVEIKKINLQDNKKAYYINQDEWYSLLEDVIEVAISDASVEVFEGNCTPFQLADMVNREEVIAIAQNLLNLTYTQSKKELPAAVNEYLTQLPGGEDWRQGKVR
ncbi:MAG: hypothetical protein Fur0025_11170 [Oscillatoriaceae cyanobacterium]